MRARPDDILFVHFETWRRVDSGPNVSSSPLKRTNRAPESMICAPRPVPDPGRFRSA